MYTNQGLTVEQKEQLVKRNGQLIELMVLDPINRPVYEGELIETNMRLVSLVLRKYGQFTEDQFQTGCIGLIVAAQTFDPSKGVPFSSYATFLINRELQAAYKLEMGWFENQFKQQGGVISSLDFELETKDNKVSLAETIADDVASYDFIKVLDDFQLAELFENVVSPVLDRVSSKGAARSSYDIELWKRIEMAMIMDMADIQTVEYSLTFTNISQMLGISIKNVKGKHDRVMEAIKEELVARRYVVQ